jgi:TIR domain
MAEDRMVRVFVGYSRSDLEFADRLIRGLASSQIEVVYDRADIAPGEDWTARLERLILESDTVILVISPASINSPQWEWEVETAIAFGKRLIPIVYKGVEDESRIPSSLRRLNFIFFDDPSSFDRALENLIIALRTDLDWIREHTRLLERANRWNQ